MLLTVLVVFAIYCVVVSTTVSQPFAGDFLTCVCNWYGVVPKGLLTFRGFSRQCGVWSLFGTSGIYPGTYSLGLFAGLSSDAMGYCLLIVLCEMTRTK